MALKINPKFKELCRSLTPEEYAQLEANIVGLGRVREEILIWKGAIVDGHHRYEIATKNKIPYDTADIEFADENAALNWIIHNQLGRRNLNPNDASYLRGKLYIAEKKDEGRPKQDEKRSQDGHVSEPERTAEKLAKETGVSANTIQRDAKKAEAVDSLPDWYRTAYRAGQQKATEKALKKAANLPQGELGQVMRVVRTEGKSLDEALGMKSVNGKPKAEPKEKPAAKKKGQPTVDARKWSDLEKHIGKAVRMNTEIKDHCKCGLDHHETIRQHLNGILNTLKEWRKECCKE